MKKQITFDTLIERINANPTKGVDTGLGAWAHGENFVDGGELLFTLGDCNDSIRDELNTLGFGVDREKGIIEYDDTLFDRALQIPFDYANAIEGNDIDTLNNRFEGDGIIEGETYNGDHVDYNGTYVEGFIEMLQIWGS